MPAPSSAMAEEASRTVTEWAAVERARARASVIPDAWRIISFDSGDGVASEYMNQQVRS
jgi:hypothetical protein